MPKYDLPEQDLQALADFMLALDLESIHEDPEARGCSEGETRMKDFDYSDR